MSKPVRNFTVSELWGPYTCESAGCQKMTFTVQLTQAENDKLPEEGGPKAVTYMCEKKLGKALCEDCRVSLE